MRRRLRSRRPFSDAVVLSERLLSAVHVPRLAHGKGAPSWLTSISLLRCPMPSSMNAKRPTILPCASRSRTRTSDPHKAHVLFCYDQYQWAEEVGFDRLMINEHHNTPSCMDVAVNMSAAVLRRMTHRAKILLLGNMLPTNDNPVRLAESRHGRRHLRWENYCQAWSGALALKRGRTIRSRTTIASVSKNATI